MKRIVALLMAAIMCMALCACGAANVSEAVADAKSQLSEWSEVTYNNYKYSGIYNEEDDSFCIVMRYMGSDSADVIAIDKMISKTASEKVFKKINKMFSNFDTFVCVVMYYPDGDYITYAENDYE